MNLSENEIPDSYKVLTELEIFLKHGDKHASLCIPEDNFTDYSVYPRNYKRILFCQHNIFLLDTMIAQLQAIKEYLKEYE